MRSGRLPPPRHDRIDGYRVAVWSDAKACPASTDTVATVEQAGDVLTSLGARVDREARPELDANAAFMQGRMKVTGNMGKLMSLMPLTQSAEYKAIQAKVAEQTEY